MKKIISNVLFSFLLFILSENHSWAQPIKTQLSQDKNAYGALNDKGEVVIPFEYSSIKSDKEFIIGTTKDMRYVFFRPDGSRITDSTYDEYRIIKPDVYAVRWRHLWGIFSKGSFSVTSNYPVIVYNDVLPGNRHGIVVKVADKYGLVTDNDNAIIFNLDNPPKDHSNGFYVIKKENKLGVVDTIGVAVIPFSLDEQMVTLKYNEALPLIEKMLTIDSSNEDLINLALLGKYRNSSSGEALSYLENLAAPIERQNPGSPCLAAVQYFRSIIFSDLCDFVKAANARAKLPISDDCDSYWVRSSIYIGNAYAKSGDYLSARKTYGEAFATCEEAQKLAQLADKEIKLRSSSNSSERSGIWDPAGVDPFPMSWDAKLRDPAQFLNGHFSQRKGLDVQYTQADCGCDFKKKDTLLVDGYCFASYKTGVKYINESTVAFEMPVTEFKITRIVKSGYLGTDSYTIYLSNKSLNLIITYNPTARLVRTKIDNYELEKSGDELVWAHQF